MIRKNTKKTKDKQSHVYIYIYIYTYREREECTAGRGALREEGKGPNEKRG